MAHLESEWEASGDGRFGNFVQDRSDVGPQLFLLDEYVPKGDLRIRKYVIRGIFGGRILSTSSGRVNIA